MRQETGFTIKNGKAVPFYLGPEYDWPLFWWSAAAVVVINALAIGGVFLFVG